jgi:hypothetical protein
LHTETMNTHIVKHEQEKEMCSSFIYWSTHLFFLSMPNNMCNIVGLYFLSTNILLCWMSLFRIFVFEFRLIWSSMQDIYLKYCFWLVSVFVPTMPWFPSTSAVFDNYFTSTSVFVALREVQLLEGNNHNSETL